MVQESYEPLVFDSTERTFQQLSCANCGEPLQMTGNGETVTCELCGQGHKSLAPPPPARETMFETGDGVAVLWGERWWSAHVVEVLGKDKWRVHYEGWAPSYDEIIDSSRIRSINYVPGSSIIPPVFEPTLKVKRANLLSAAGIIAVVMVGVAFLMFWALGDQVFSVHPQMPAEMEGADFGAITGRTPGLSIDEEFFIQPGQSFYVKWGSGWYLGKVLDVETQDKILIRYVGWGDEQDELVPRSRLRAVR